MYINKTISSVALTNHSLLSLEKYRQEENKGIVVTATWIEKTYLVAFDSAKYNRILFVVHREEIIKYAEKSFKNVINS